ncbi:ABC transporter substrate-binding protein [Metabacillus arenae]|uniref:Sugar ABC transporter substrate-binding protein n=1 Tax=Metabacillus arenae TaxID=2771434 RepID=A0A926RZM5_9BACI|nr:sugar ABC transporter substrate-binding protein [Metabacillus arenae]MBD1382412.1 sugar ABC transporter substrate-binding protein [Metabacillus arenae]
MLKRFMSTVLSVFIIFTIVSGCVSNSVDSNGENGSDQIELRFSWWGGEDRHKATLAAIEKYMELNPHVKIKAEYSGFDGYNQKLSTQLAGKTAPDIMQMDFYYMAEFAQKGEQFIDFYEYEKQIDISSFDEKFLKDFSEVNGKLIGLPTGINSIIFFGNKKILEKTGINLEGKYDWEKLLEEGKKINQNNPKEFLLNMGPDETSMLIAYYIQQKSGNNFIQDDYTLGFDKKLAEEAFTYMKNLWDEGVLPEVSDYVTVRGNLEQTPKWVSGDLGIVLMSASGINIFKNSNNELTPLLPPTHKGAKDSGIRTQPSQVFSVSKHSKHPEEAVKFINWMLNDEEAINILGSTRGAQPTETGREFLSSSGQLDPLVAEGVDLGLENAGMPINAISLNTEADKIYVDIVEKIGYGQITPEEGATQLVKELNEYLSDIKP